MKAAPSPCSQLEEILEVEKYRVKYPNIKITYIGNSKPDDVVESKAIDSMLSPYEDLKTVRHLARVGKFIVEGFEPITLLLKRTQNVSSETESSSSSSTKDDSSISFQTISLLVRYSIFARLMEGLSSGSSGSLDHLQNLHFLIASRQFISNVVGFNSRGSLALGVIPRYALTVSWLLGYLANRKCYRITVIDGSNDPSNVGSIIRTSSAFGATACLISADSCDPWYRKAIRTSMGHIFNIPVVVCGKVKTAAEVVDHDNTSNSTSLVDQHITELDLATDLVSVLLRLKSKQDAHIYSAVVQKEGCTMMSSLPHGSVPDRYLTVVGSESRGVSSAVRAVSDTLLRVDMSDNVDSVAITVATGIVLNGLREREKKGRPW
eukprot:g2948.t1